MVKIDDQIRGEMNEHFRLEKMEITDAWTIKHATEMQNLRDSMTAHHHYELMTAIEKTETDYKEQINVLTNEHNIRTEEWERLRVELQDKIMGLEINIKMLTKGLVDLKEDNNRRIAQIMEEHAKFLEQEHKNFEYELQAKETQLKVASTIALGNLEKKHASIMEELDADHKRNMDDLKNTNTKNALAAKKDAENKLNVEVARLKGIHAEEMETLSNLSAEEMAKAMLSMNMTRMAELKDQAEAHQQTVDTFNSRIAELNEEILRRVVRDQLSHMRHRNSQCSSGSRSKFCETGR
ncbi:hypothetical protein BC830DRAFT_145039 [Chytriomyces sp. MP71]|nr:hypothetical protein BC830DRAFT_145039 [Chytriomyces sp. MP71]